MDYYKKGIILALGELESNEDGLSKNDAALRLLKHGRNTLPETPTPGLFQIFVSQFKSSLIYILLAAAIIVFAMGDYIDGLIILVVLLVNAIVGSVQEGRAQNTLKALKQFTQTEAFVMRDGEEIMVPDTEIVPGDIILLEEGNKIPADARIMQAVALHIDESALTGESQPVQKNHDVIEQESLAIADQKNMLFKGTYVVSGHAKALVVATGVSSYIGGISVKLESIDTDVPLKAHIKNLSRFIITIVGIITIFIFVLGIIRGHSVGEMFLTVVAIAVSAIPEGLPVVVTLVLATGVWRMGKRNALVKRLQAVEALGQAKIIAVDKTGTITKNQMMASRLFVNGTMYEIDGDGYSPHGSMLKNGDAIEPLSHEDVLTAGKIAAFCATAVVAYSEEKKDWQRIAGDPTDAALLVFSQKLGFNKQDLENEHPKISEIPFDSNIKYHAVINEDIKPFASYIGAPEMLLSAASTILVDGKRKKISKTDRIAMEQALVDMSQQGLRVLALAAHFTTPLSFKGTELPKLCIVGLVGISDVIRPEASKAVADARNAGVRVVMITGDYVDTAQAIARKAGIYRDGDEVITGQELDTLTEEELRLKFRKVSVFARVSPEHKLKIIEGYRKRGEIIAMTGDGVNDALSLAAADLGVAMGRVGTEVAKEASDIVLLDDNFGSIIGAIEEGRNIYRTIKKVILYLFSTSLGEIITITGAIMFGYPVPLLAGQIIWLNMVTDGFLVAALAMEPKDQTILSQPFQKPSRWMIDSLDLKRMILMGMVMGIGALIIFTSYLSVDFATASTMALTVLAIFQWFNAWNCRSHIESIFSRKSIFGNMYLVGALVVVVMLQCVALYVPFMQKILHLVPLSFKEWGIVLAMALTVIVVEEMRKFLVRKKSVIMGMFSKSYIREEQALSSAKKI